MPGGCIFQRSLQRCENTAYPLFYPPSQPDFPFLIFYFFAVLHFPPKLRLVRYWGRGVDIHKFGGIAPFLPLFFPLLLSFPLFSLSSPFLPSFPLSPCQISFFSLSPFFLLIFHFPPNFWDTVLGGEGGGGVATYKIFWGNCPYGLSLTRGDSH